MADLESRVAVLERDLAALKQRQAATDADVQNLPQLIKLEHRFTNTRIDRLAQDMDDLKVDFARMKDDFARMKDTVEKLPRAVAEIVREILEEKAPRG
jgi:outer membrane murein-binding lipoprotein Lpp